MILSLEFLQANEGDCLILHYGKENAPQIAVIDGGPSGIYTNYLKPRLLEIKGKLSPEEPLPIPMLMVSHADDDHINGIVMLTNNLVQQQNDGETPLFKINSVWFNSFDDIVGNTQIPIVSSISNNVAAVATQIKSNPILNDSEKEHIVAVVASTGQGRTIRDNALTLGIPVNTPFKPLPPTNIKLVRGDTENAKSELAANISIHVVHPNEQRLIELQKQWDKDLKKAKKGDTAAIISSLVDTDKSPFNLSSIVCLIQHGNKKILITGDSRSKDIYDGLERNNLLDADGKLHVDILKMPHHGSKANMTRSFLESITADHYVISADGKHNNPDQDVLDMFEQHVKSGMLHLTNYNGKLQLKKKLDIFIQKLKDGNNQLKVVFPDAGKNSSIINLLKPVKY